MFLKFKVISWQSNIDWKVSRATFAKILIKLNIIIKLNL